MTYLGRRRTPLFLKRPNRMQANYSARNRNRTLHPHFSHVAAFVSVHPAADDIIYLLRRLPLRFTSDRAIAFFDATGNMPRGEGVCRGHNTEKIPCSSTALWS